MLSQQLSPSLAFSCSPPVLSPLPQPLLSYFSQLPLFALMTKHDKHKSQTMLDAAADSSHSLSVTYIDQMRVRRQEGQLILVVVAKGHNTLSVTRISSGTSAMVQRQQQEQEAADELPVPPVALGRRALHRKPLKVLRLGRTSGRQHSWCVRSKVEDGRCR